MGGPPRAGPRPGESKKYTRAHTKYLLAQSRMDMIPVWAGDGPGRRLTTQGVTG